MSSNLIGACTEHAVPPPKFTVSQWADAKRILPETSAARGGRWRTSLTPYLRGVMDAINEVPQPKKIAFMKCAQSGGSEALMNVLGYHVEYDPCAMLMIYPTAQAAEAWVKERFMDMTRTTPALAAAVRTKRAKRGSHEAESTLALQMFAGGYLAIGGANTPNSFARWSARLAFGDDVDRFPAEVGEEGDPADLLVNRTTTFLNGCSFFVSTPTVVDGRIDTLYKRSDQRKFHVPCLKCGYVDFITWSDKAHFRVTWDDQNPHSARIECPSCGHRMDEVARRQMIQVGDWKPTETPMESGLVGFHLPAMVSTLGNVTLPHLVERFISSKAKGAKSFRTFVNTALAEAWDDRPMKIEPHVFMSRREDFEVDRKGTQVPGSAYVLTAGVDVQVDRFELQVIGWGLDERVTVDWRTIPGDPKKPEIRQALIEALEARYRHEFGADLPILATCVDTGWATEEMYDLVLGLQHRRVFATKGFAGRTGEPIVGKPSDKKTGKNPRPVRLFPINVDDGKTDVMDALVERRWRFGMLVDEEYFAQLCSEHKEKRLNQYGVAVSQVWVKDRERNEALDTAVLALAAFRLLRPNLHQMAELLSAPIKQEKAASPLRAPVRKRTQNYAP